MSLPIDEMVLELRFAIEAFDQEPCARLLDTVFKETMRINTVCEDLYVESEED